MSLNEMQLHPGHLTRWYPGGLMIRQEAAPDRKIVEALPQQGWIPVGSDTSDPQLVVVYTGNAPLPPAEATLLQKILSACGVEESTVGMLALPEGTPPPLQYIRTLYSPALWLLFGIEPLSFGLPMHFPPHRLQSFDGGQYLHAPALGALQDDAPGKKALWSALKTHFGC